MKTNFISDMAFLDNDYYNKRINSKKYFGTTEKAQTTSKLKSDLVACCQETNQVIHRALEDLQPVLN